MKLAVENSVTLLLVIIKEDPPLETDFFFSRYGSDLLLSRGNRGIFKFHHDLEHSGLSNVMMTWRDWLVS